MTSLDWNVSITALSVMSVVTNTRNLSEPQTSGRVCLFVQVFLNFTNKNSRLGVPNPKCVISKDWPSSSRSKVHLPASQFL